MSIKFRALSGITAATVAAASIFMFGGCSTRRKVLSSDDIAPHLIATPDAEPVRPISAREGKVLSEISGTLTDAQYRARISELYSVVVEDKMRPVFAADDPVKPIYDNAVDILNRYILNAWHAQDAENGDVMVIHTLHDYLVANITYDFDLYERYENGENVDDNPAFDIDGVFINKLAVCDGLSRAYNFLCAIEGIDAIRVTGRFAGGPHAWNKVKVDGKWYNVDVTADAANYKLNNDGFKMQLSHGFFMLSDETLKVFNVGNPSRRHVFETAETITGAFEDYDYYKDKTVTIGSEIYPHLITSQAMLNDLFTKISEQGGAVGKIEVQLRFPGKANINYADMYKEEIKEAYSKLNSPDFALTATQTPYFQYPNGVYLFLMYM